MTAMTFDREALVNRMKKGLQSKQEKIVEEKKASDPLLFSIPKSIFEELLRLKSLGTECYKNKQYEDSLAAYSKAIDYAKKEMVVLACQNSESSDLQLVTADFDSKNKATNNQYDTTVNQDLQSLSILKHASDPQIPLTVASILANRALVYLQLPELTSTANEKKVGKVNINVSGQSGISNAHRAFSDCQQSLEFCPTGSKDLSKANWAFCKYAYRKAQAADKMNLQGVEKSQMLKELWDITHRLKELGQNVESKAAQELHYKLSCKAPPSALKNLALSAGFCIDDESFTDIPLVRNEDAIPRDSDYFREPSQWQARSMRDLQIKFDNNTTQSENDQDHDDQNYISTIKKKPPIDFNGVINKLASNSIFKTDTGPGFGGVDASQLGGGGMAATQQHDHRYYSTAEVKVERGSEQAKVLEKKLENSEKNYSSNALIDLDAMEARLDRIKMECEQFESMAKVSKSNNTSSQIGKADTITNVKESSSNSILDSSDDHDSSENLSTTATSSSSSAAVRSSMEVAAGYGNIMRPIGQLHLVDEPESDEDEEEITAAGANKRKSDTTTTTTSDNVGTNLTIEEIEDSSDLLNSDKNIITNENDSRKNGDESWAIKSQAKSAMLKALSGNLDSEKRSAAATKKSEVTSKELSREESSKLEALNEYQRRLEQKNALLARWRDKGF